MKRKIVILGGRSGTSLMLRLIEAAGYKAWTAPGSTEPPIAAEIYEDPFDKERIKKALDFDDWEVAKLPEFAFCIPELIARHDPIFIWMTRPWNERVESHRRLGWHKIIAKRCRKFPKLAEFIGGNKSENYFWKIDDLCWQGMYPYRLPDNTWQVEYDALKKFQVETLVWLCQIINITFTPALWIEWNKIKSQPQQAGKFK